MEPSLTSNNSDALPYQWRQTLQDVTIIVPLPAGTRAKFVTVDIKKKSISAALKASPAEPFIKGDLFNEITVDESTWSVVDQKELSITLEKVNQTEWWPHVVISAPKIDVRKIQPENSKLSDLDGETRAMVEKMMVCTTLLPGDVSNKSSLTKSKSRWACHQARSSRNKRFLRSLRNSIPNWTSARLIFKCNNSNNTKQVFFLLYNKRV